MSLQGDILKWRSWHRRWTVLQENITAYRVFKKKSCEQNAIKLRDPVNILSMSVINNELKTATVLLLTSWLFAQIHV